MPEQADVVSGEIITDEWGNAIRDRTLQRYANTTARTAGNPSPDAGELSYQGDSGAVDVYHAGAWRNLGVGHKHAGEDLTGGTVPVARLPIATTSVRGITELEATIQPDNDKAATPGSVKFVHDALTAHNHAGIYAPVHSHPYLSSSGGTVAGPLDVTGQTNLAGGVFGDLYLNGPTTTTNGTLSSHRHDGGPPYRIMPLLSSARYKRGIRDLEVEGLVDELRAVRLRQWQDKGSAKDSPWISGVVAEEITSIGGKVAEGVGLDEEGKPLSFDMATALSVHLIAAVQQLLERVATLEATVVRLEGATNG